MIPDPTDEIRAIRNRLAAECNYDLDRIVEETRRRQRNSGRVYVALCQGRRSETATDPQTAAGLGFGCATDTGTTAPENPH
jgi:hypothetical protein